MSRSPLSRLSLCAAAFGALAITAFALAPSRAAEDAVIIPAPATDVQAADGVQTIVVAGGCFWGVQGVFQHTAGVVNAVSGYAGGNKSTADYNMVSTGTTGHAESVEIKYDPAKISGFAFGMGVERIAMMRTGRAASRAMPRSAPAMG